MLIDGASHEPGTPEHRRALWAAMVAAHRRLTAQGTHVYLAEVPPQWPPAGCENAADNPQCAINATFNACIPYVNTQLRWLADRYDDTRVISLEDVICPGGPPCLTTVDEVAVRPDGTQFSDALAPRVAKGAS